jgi:23S rRNA pseudouridine1911/1915/1917 synthase
MLKFESDTTDRLDKFVASKSSVSRGRVQIAIKDSLVQINGKVVTQPDHRLRVGDLIELPEFSDESLQPMEYDLKIVFENEDLMVIDKPSNLVVHPGAGHKQDTLSNALIAKYPEIARVGEPARPGIVHRLDEDTSGLILVAKTMAGYDYAKNLFLTREVQKEYITLVHGIPAKLHDIIRVPIGRTSTHMKMSVIDGSTSSGKSNLGKEAITEYRVLATNEKASESQSLPEGVDEMALIRVKLHTGRTHQIRVHMAHIGHPVVGDQLYGGNFKKSDASLINRQFLHAAQLKFKLPNGTNIDVSSPLPEELQDFLSKVKINFKQ